MASRPSQIPMDLPLASADTREDFIVGAANAIAVGMIDRWPDWPGRVVVLTGPPGSGKSHLARVWARVAGAAVAEMAAIGQDSIPAAGPLVLEDAAPGMFDEESVFHLLNHLRAERLDCLVTSREPPGGWNVKLADLRSRLVAAQLVILDAPDDKLLAQVIVKLFADRQLAPDSGVVSYLVARMERSLQAARRIVAEIDRVSLARGGRINRAAAAIALKNLGMG